MKNDPQKVAEAINGKVLPKLRILDWALAFATLGWGIWKMSPIWIGIGVLGFILAWLDPGSHIKRGLERMFLGSRRRPAAPPIEMPVIAKPAGTAAAPALSDRPRVIESPDGILHMNWGAWIPPQARQ